MTQKVRPTLLIEMNVTCPGCSHYFDLVADTNLNEDGWLLDQVLPEDTWIDAHAAFECTTICPKCSAEFECEGVRVVDHISTIKGGHMDTKKDFEIQAVITRRKDGRYTEVEQDIKLKLSCSCRELSAALGAELPKTLTEESALKWSNSMSKGVKSMLSINIRPNSLDAIKEVSVLDYGPTWRGLQTYKPLGKKS